MSASDVCHPPLPPAISDEPQIVASPSRRSRQPWLVDVGGRHSRLQVAGDEKHNMEEKEDEGDACCRGSTLRRESNGAPASGRSEDSEALASRSDAESPDRRFDNDGRRDVDAVLHSSAARVVAAPAAAVTRQKHRDRLAEQQFGVLPTRLAALAGATISAPGADSIGDRIAEADAATADSVAGGPDQTTRLAGCCQFHRSGGSSRSNCCCCAVDDAVAPVKLPSADFVTTTVPRCGCEQHERSDHHYARAVFSSALVIAGERPMSAIVEETSTCVDEGFDDDEDDAAPAADNECSEDEEEEDEEGTEDDSSSGSLRRRRRRKSSTSDLEKLKRLTARLGLNARRPSYTAWQQQLVAAAAADAAPPTTPFSSASFSAAAIAANFAAAAGRPRRADASAAAAAAGEAEATSAAWKSAATLKMCGDSGGGSGVVEDACNRYDGEGADRVATSGLVRPAADAAATAAGAGVNAATDIRTTISRVDQLLRSLKTELIKMQETDQRLAKQFIALRQDVQQLRLQQARLRYEDLIDEAAAQLEVAAAVAGGRPGYEELLSDDGLLPPAPPSLLRGRLDSSTSSGIGGCSCDPDTTDALAQLASIGITKMNLLERRFSVF